MPFKIIKVPREQQELADVGLEIVVAANDLGKPVDSDGFLRAWLSGTKVLAEVNDKGKIIGLAFMVSGRRWFEDFDTATLLNIMGENKDGMMDFANSVASASGAYSLIYDTGEEEKLPDGTVRHYIHEVLL